METIDMFEEVSLGILLDTQIYNCIQLKGIMWCFLGNFSLIFFT